VNVFELFFFMLHAGLFIGAATLCGRKYGWPAGLIAGVVAVSLMIAGEKLLATLGNIFRKRNSTDDTP
jgi:hypothetical protein